MEEKSHGKHFFSSLLFVVVLSLVCVLLLQSAIAATASSNCYQYSSQSTCTTNNCYWKTSGSNSWCEGYSCFIADDTNQTFCETLNTTYSLNFSCKWTSAGELCDPVG